MMSRSPFSVSVDEAWCSATDVCTGTYKEEEDEEEGLEVEQGRLEPASAGCQMRLAMRWSSP